MISDLKACHLVGFLIGCIAVLVVSSPLGAQKPEVARTPPMGLNMWGGFGVNVTAADVRGEADALVSSGMNSLGYQYVIIDGVWEGKRDEKGFIHPNERLRDIKALADYVHGKGLKLGLYSTPGPKTCGPILEGSLGHEEQDAKTYADWGVDFLKYDCCSFGDLTKAGKVLHFKQRNPDFDAAADMAGYKRMGEALAKTGRPIVYSLCQYGMDRVWSWGASVGGNMWRTTIDIEDKWDSVSAVGFGQNGLERFAGPGHWNDPDMLYMKGGMNVEEYRTQMSLWCLLAAPIILCNDVKKLTPEELALLTNPEVVAVDQDPAAIQGHRITQEGPLEVWVKPLADGSKAVCLFNRQYTLPSSVEPAYADRPVPITVHFRDIGVGEKAAVRDLWARRDLGMFSESYTAPVPTHGVAMIKLR
jgi:alpha-galactosidase